MSSVFWLCVLALAASSLAGPASSPAVGTQHVAEAAAPADAAALPAAVQNGPVVEQAPAATVSENLPLSEGPRGARSFVDNSVQGSQFEDNLLRKLNNKCTQRDPSSCAMLKLVTYMNRLLKKHNIELTDNVEITTTTSFVQVEASDLPRSLSSEPEETQLAELMMSKLTQFVKSRALRLRVLPTTDVVLTSTPDKEGNLNFGVSMETVPEQTGRGKNKNMGGILAAIVMKMGMLGALAFKGLALLVGKALLVSKIALLLAVVLGLKKLFSQQKHVTYEVVAQPHHSHSHVEHVEHGHGSSGGGHDSYSSGWSRSLGVAPVGKGDGQDLAYGSYAPK